MEFINYLQKTLRKGSFLVKAMKIRRFVQHTIYSVFKNKIGVYPEPPLNLQEVGYFDKNRLVHTDENFSHYFNEINLYKEGDFVSMKQGLISLALINDKILVKKTFSGIQKFNRFYNEIICLNRLKNLECVPKIIFVDYAACSVYMEYLDGVCVSRKRKNNRINVDENNFEELKNGFMSVLKKIHDQGVIMYDLRHDNMMIYNSTYFLFDFGDSIYFGKMAAKLFKWLKKREEKKLLYELYLSVTEGSFKEKLGNKLGINPV